MQFSPTQTSSRAQVARCGEALTPSNGSHSYLNLKAGRSIIALNALRELRRLKGITLVLSELAVDKHALVPCVAVLIPNVSWKWPFPRSTVAAFANPCPQPSGELVLISEPWIAGSRSRPTPCGRAGKGRVSLVLDAPNVDRPRRQVLPVETLWEGHNSPATGTATVWGSTAPSR